jgi:hypothetical protein
VKFRNRIGVDLVCSDVINVPACPVALPKHTQKPIENMILGWKRC